MSYLCFVETTLSSVPHLRVLLSEDLDHARQEAGELLRERPAGVAAHVFDGDDRLATIRPEDLGS